MFDRNWTRPGVHPCELCQGEATYKIGASIMQAAFPDGNRRFQSLRETRVLEKAKKKAFWKQDKKEKARLDTEIKKVNR